MLPSRNPAEPHAARQHWMGILARADAATLADHMGADLPAWRHLRQPETGLVMVRGRTGGAGQPFNLGEMTVTRCAVRLDDGTVGHAYVRGRDRRHAELAAIADALLQRDATLVDRLIVPLAAAQAATRRDRSCEAAATRVEFFTVARESSGGDEEGE
jgi:alpha-D-ribose 1-methylphosphonate 5-triphosphate synthase subunit PhnG